MSLIDHKINKYIHKLSIDTKGIYVRKLVKYLYMSQSNQRGSGYDVTKIDSVIEKIKSLSNTAYSQSQKTSNKYILFLYGPPASGKTIARKVAYQYIIKYFDKNIEMDVLEKSFVDTNVDDLTYDLNVDNNANTTVKDTLVQKFDEFIKYAYKKKNPTVSPNTKVDIYDTLKENLEKITENSFNIYNTNRKKVDPLSELMVYFAILFNLNIIVEIASPYIDYVMKVINSTAYYGYIPVVVYPYVNSLDELMKRMFKRGIVEGRFINCDGATGLREKMKNMINNYGSLRDAITKDVKNYKKYLLIQYDAILDEDTYNLLKSPDPQMFLEGFDKIKTIEIAIKKDENSNSIKYSTSEYDNQIKLIDKECKDVNKVRIDYTI